MLNKKLNEDEQEVALALLEAGFDADDIPALMGNIDVETGGSFDFTQKQDGGSGYGLFQFDGGHKKAYLNWIEDSGLEDSALQQATFVYNNIYGKKHPYDLGWKARGMLKDAFSGNSAQDKASTFSNVYERPSKPHMERRVNSTLKFEGLLTG
jgi:hypothetical protein